MGEGGTYPNYPSLLLWVREYPSFIVTVGDGVQSQLPLSVTVGEGGTCPNYPSLLPWVREYLSFIVTVGDGVQS